MGGANSRRDAYDDVMRTNGGVALIVSGLRKSLGDSAMMAYLVMMAARLIGASQSSNPRPDLSICTVILRPASTLR